MEATVVKKRRFTRKLALDIVSYAALGVLTVFFMFPFFAMVTGSLMTDEEALFFPKLIPESFYLGAYERAINEQFWRYFLNTVIVIALNIIGITFSASLVAYGFAKLKFKGREVMFGVVLSTMMLPSIAMQIPLYILYSKMGWIGTWLPMVVPAFFGGGAVNVFLIRQFMKGIPNELSEAMCLDGAGKFRIFYSMIVPLCKPIIIYVMVTCFLGVWNDFMTPLMYLQTEESKYTLSIGLYYQFRAGMSADNYPNVQMAAGVVMILPCIVVFAFFQKSLINGVATFGIKG